VTLLEHALAGRRAGSLEIATDHFDRFFRRSGGCTGLQRRIDQVRIDEMEAV
jgi:hypothetical protein